MIFLNLVKANAEIDRLKKGLVDMTADRDTQLLKLQEFEKTNKEFIESAQTAEQMKDAHKKELDTLKSEYETKLADKDKELVKVKEDSQKQISATKESVVAESIALVASQGTNVIIDVQPDNTAKTPHLDALAKLSPNEMSVYFLQNNKEILKEKKQLNKKQFKGKI